MFKEILQKLASEKSHALERRHASQGSSRERVKSYGSVSGKGQRESASAQLEARIKESLR